MKYSIRIICALGMALLMLSACGSLPNSAKPAGWIFDQVPEDASDIYKQAYNDGCSSGFASMSNSGYREFYEFTQDPILRKNPEYYKTWKDTFTFCRHYVYGIVREGNTRNRNPENISSLGERVLGGHGVLKYGLLNLWGPGKAHMFFDNFNGVDGGMSLGAGDAMVWGWNDHAIGKLGAEEIWTWSWDK